MKRSVTTLIVLALVAGLLPGFLMPPMANAAPAADLTALAAFFPANTPFFAALRIDDGHIEALDGLLNAIGARLPAGVLLPGVLRAGLDAAVQESHPDGSFAADVRPWLGDFGAVGVTTIEPLVDDDPTNDNDLPSAVVAQITDRDAAEAFFEPIMAPGMEAGYFELRQTADFTLYASSDPAVPVSLMLTDDLLVLALAGLDPTQAVPAATLAEDATFQRGLAALPAADYNAAVYLSGPAVAAIGATQAEGLTVFGMDAQSTMADTVAGMMVGLTILDGATLTIDAVTLTDADTSAAMADVLGGGGAISPAFDAFLPGGAQFMARATDLRGSLEALVALIRASQPGAERDLDEVATNIREGVQQVLGLDADEDIVSWLTGDFGVTFSLDPTLVDVLFNTAGDEPPTIERIPFDLGVVVAAVDPAKARALVAALSDQLPALLAEDPNANVTMTLETIGGYSTIVLSIPADGGDIPLPPLDILIGASEDVFALGTRPIVTAALEPGDGLASQAAYTRARSYALPGAASFGYVSSAGVQGLGDLFGGAVLLGPQIGEVFTEIEGGLVATLTPEQLAEQARQQEAQRQQAVLTAQMARAQIQNVLGLIESLTFSTAPGGDGAYLQRLTLTLAP